MHSIVIVKAFSYLAMRINTTNTPLMPITQSSRTKVTSLNYDFTEDRDRTVSQRS